MTRCDDLFLCHNDLEMTLDLSYFDSCNNAILQYFDSKMLSDSISEHLIFENFLGGMLPDPPSNSMLHSTHADCTSHNNRYNCLCTLQKYPTLTMCP